MQRHYRIERNQASSLRNIVSSLPLVFAAVALLSVTTPVESFAHWHRPISFTFRNRRAAVQPTRRTHSTASSNTDSTSNPAVTMMTPSTPTAVYTDEQLKSALETLWLQTDSSDTQQDSTSSNSHLFGYRDGAFLESHELSMLQRITATVLLDCEATMAAENAPSIEALEHASVDFAQEHGAIVDLFTVIVNANTQSRMALAAEFKRASPSKGDIDVTLKAGQQAVRYATAGADIISCLTEPRWFKGSLQDLTEIRLETSAAVAVVTATATSINRANRPAILRKDFVVNRYMIAQAAAAGADSVLLIVAVLSEWLLSDLILYCRTQLQMEPLVEVHSDDELDVAHRAGAKVIGVNNRNLHTFQLDLTTSERMAARLTSMGLSFRPVSNSDSKDDTTATTPPPQYALCALSGMSTCYDVDRYRQAGLSMCLIGESLMRAADPQAAIASLCLNAADFTKMTSGGKGSSSTDGVVDAATASTTVAAYTQGTQLVKVCGITNADDALVACRAGAQLIGVIFVPKSPRCVATTEQAQAIVQTVRAFGERSDRCDFGTLPTAVNGSPIAQLRQSSDALAQTVRQRPVVVGVFQNQDAQYIRDMVQDCGLDMVQLHGGEGMAAANRHNFGVPVIRVVDISVDPTTGAKMTTTDDPVPAVLQGITHDPAVILLDTAIKGGSGGGGTGLIFDWSIASRLQDAGLPVIVAGGLTAESVPDCVTRIRPFGVDVSSGVEAAPGRKDHDKVQQFVSGAKMAAAQAQKGF